MPCNSIILAQVELGKVNQDLLALAMKELGFIYSYQNGIVTVRGRQTSPELTAQIKQMYSKQVVLSQAKKFGWKLQEVKPFQYEVTKR